MRSVFINVKKGMSELGRWLSAKHTTVEFIYGILKFVFYT